MSGRRRWAATAVSVAVGMLLLTGCDFSVYQLPLPGGADVGSHPYTVTARFRDVLDLVPQSAVKVDNVTVGKVTDISLHGWTADVRLQLARSVRLPDNAVASVKQTSLLGEKFVALSPPPGRPVGRLSDGDVIPLSHSGRNPEVEEVLGALSLLLNGGGVAQLKTITVELNKALTGNEPAARNLLTQLRTFTTTVDRHKTQIVTAIRALNRLAVSARRQKTAIIGALDRLPAALRSLDRQRHDLVRMLHALSRLSTVGTRVIEASKADTLANLRRLAPVLAELSRAGRALPRSLGLFFTYPFVDATVGRTPAEARHTHIGDYTNLDAKLDLDLRHGLPTVPGLPNPPSPLPPLPSLPSLPPLPTVPDIGQVCHQFPNLPLCGGHGPVNLDRVCRQFPGLPVCGGSRRSGGGLPTPLPTLPTPLPTGDTSGSDGSGSGGCTLPLLCRPAPRYGPGGARSTVRVGPAPGPAYDPDVVRLLLQGVVAQ